MDGLAEGVDHYYERSSRLLSFGNNLSWARIYFSESAIYRDRVCT
jgi:hypothetical protein